MISLEGTLESDLAIIKNYIDVDLGPSQTTTTHVFEKQVPKYIKKYIENVKNSKNITSHLLNLSSSQNLILPVTEMNEVYCAKHRGTCSKAGSDAVFETEHIDGPFGMIPKMTLFRCIITICNETETETVIKEEAHRMKEGQAVAIDYNRDLHYIKIKDGFTPSQDAKRYVLKLHYISYPSRCPMFAVRLFRFLNVNYNRLARKAFLYALNPKTYPQKMVNFIINTTTKLWSKMFHGKLTKKM